MSGGPDSSVKKIQSGIRAVELQEYLLGLTILSEAYADGAEGKDPTGLSFYGLTLALVQRKFKPAIELCKKAIELQFYNPSHYANMGRVYLAAGHRKKALGSVEEGLKLFEDDRQLLRVREEIGLRARPAVPFLSRQNPINQAIGRTRHAKKTKV